MDAPDHQLLAAVRRGDADAFARLVQRHRRMVYGLGLSITRDPATAEDVCQEAFIALARSAHRIETAVGAWLYGATRRIACRLRPRPASPALPAAAATVDDHPGEWIEAVDVALARLDDGDRTLLILRFLDERTLEEIAAELDIGIATAHRRIAAATQRLRRELERGGVLGAVPLAAVPADPPAALCAKLGKIGMASPAAAAATASAGSATLAAGLIAAGLAAAGGLAWLAADAAPSGPAAAVAAAPAPGPIPAPAPPPSPLDAALAGIDVAAWRDLARTLDGRTWFAHRLGRADAAGPAGAAPPGLMIAADGAGSALGLLAARTGAAIASGDPAADGLRAWTIRGADAGGGERPLAAMRRMAPRRAGGGPAPALRPYDGQLRIESRHDQFAVAWHPHLAALAASPAPQPWDAAVIVAGLHWADDPELAAAAWQRALALGMPPVRSGGGARGSDDAAPQVAAAIAYRRADPAEALAAGLRACAIDPANLPADASVAWPPGIAERPLWPRHLAAWSAMALGRQRLAHWLLAGEAPPAEVRDAPAGDAWTAFMAQPGRDLLAEGAAAATGDADWRQQVCDRRLHDVFISTRPRIPPPVDITVGQIVDGDWALACTVRAVDTGPWWSGARGWLAIVAVPAGTPEETQAWASAWAAADADPDRAGACFGTVLEDVHRYQAHAPGGARPVDGRAHPALRLAPELDLGMDRPVDVRLVAHAGRGEVWVDGRLVQSVAWPGGAWRLVLARSRLSHRIAGIRLMGSGGRMDATGSPAALIADDGPLDAERVRALRDGLGKRPDLLHLAAVHGHARAVAALLDGGRADPHARTGRTQTPLTIAGMQAEVIDRLLAAGADANAMNGYGWGALDYAIYYADSRAIRRLIDHGARCQWDGMRSGGPWHDWLGASAARPDIVELLRERGLIPPALAAMLLGDGEAVRAALPGMPEIAADIRGAGTLLHWAVLTGQLDAAQAILDRGASPDAAAGPQRLTPLDWAVDRCADESAAAWLLDRGAKPVLAQPGLGERARRAGFAAPLVARLTQGAPARPAGEDF